MGVLVAAFSALSLPRAGAQVPPLPPVAPVPSICVNAHVQNVGWQGWTCGSRVQAGTIGRTLRMEALAIATTGTGGVCARAHVQNIGWQPLSCRSGDREPVVVGTTGQSLRIEALTLEARSGLCAEAHVQNVGDQGWRCGDSIELGTTGQSLQMEAVRLTIPLQIL